MSTDTRRSEAATHARRLYKTARWRRMRLLQLGEHPLCERCATMGRVVPATVVNHRVAHKGSPDLFWDAANLASVCKPCHDGEIQSREATGREYDSAVGGDGMPIDPAHPWYSTRDGERERQDRGGIESAKARSGGPAVKSAIYLPKIRHLAS